jgi:hypothetical protein
MTENSSVNKYRLKPEFGNLFANLSGGKDFFENEAFNTPGEVMRKSYGTEDEGRQHAAILAKLVADGFVEIVPTGVSYVPKP